MITAVTGLNGAGKTAYAAGMLKRWQDRGVKTAANIGVEGSQLVRNFDDLMQLRDCVLLIDEVTAVASSRQFASLTPEALLFFQTLRHSNIGLIWTAPTFDRCDLALRSLTLYWVHVTAAITKLPKGGIWRNTLVSITRSGRPIDGPDGEAKMLAPMPWLYRPARHHAVYDSYADVDLFTRTQRFPSRCPDCGLSIDYGRKRASTERTGDDFTASFYCPQCGHQLGSITRPLSNSPSIASAGRPSTPVEHPFFGVAESSPIPDNTTTAGAEHLRLHLGQPLGLDAAVTDPDQAHGVPTGSPVGVPA